MIATATLFAACIPISIGVVLARPQFEKYLKESYNADYSKFSPELRSLVDSIEKDFRDGRQLTTRESFERDQELTRLTLEIKRQIYEDWIRRQTLERARSARKLAQVDPELFLGWAEQTVVCGDAPQRRAALDFLEFSKNPSAARHLERLLAWARRCKMQALAAEIDATRVRTVKATDAPAPAIP